MINGMVVTGNGKDFIMRKPGTRHTEGCDRAQLATLVKRHYTGKAK